jgi:hypothetical protein
MWDISGSMLKVARELLVVRWFALGKLEVARTIENSRQL